MMVAQKETFKGKKKEGTCRNKLVSGSRHSELSVFVSSRWNLDAALKWPTPTINAEIYDEVNPTLNNCFFILIILHLRLADLRLWTFILSFGSSWHGPAHWTVGFSWNCCWKISWLLPDVFMVTFIAQMLVRQHPAWRLLLNLTQKKSTVVTNICNFIKTVLWD